ncbi:MAG: Gfo/Idh/MocA family oxidoreductase [Phycisphaerae bacterium]|nr:Gfo/Idh/MocA family oxidoreductase [Phycisphaerae bacterium]
MKRTELSRRRFVGQLAAAGVFSIVPRHVLGRGQTPPSEKLNVACIGCGGMGGNDVRNMESQNIVALCDVDARRAAETFKRHAKTPKFKDFRRMLDKMDKQIDAVTVTTPDHIHFPAAMHAIRLGKHVFVQKPMAHGVGEVRQLTEAARKAKVATQMGIQGHAGQGWRIIKEWVDDGAIGAVRQVHCWTNKPVWPQGIGRPKDTPKVPDGLDWEMWLGPSPKRPYHPAYLPFTWRGWWDFGSCALGDMGCHVINTPFSVLELGNPVSVEAYSTKVNDETGPLASTIYYEFGARGKKPPVRVTWFDGGIMPPWPVGLEITRRRGDNEGVVFIGETGKIICTCYGGGPRIFPESKMLAYKRPPKTIPRSIGHYREWIAACKGGKPAGANFEHSGPLTELVQLGNVAIRAGRRFNNNGLYARIEWDAKNLKIPNAPKVEKYLHKTYRKY